MQSLLDYIGALKTSQGWNRSKLFAVLPWERRFLAGTFKKVALKPKQDDVP